MERRRSTSALVVLAAVFLLVAGLLWLVTGALFGVLGGLVAGLESVDGAGTGGFFGATGGAVVVYGIAVVAWGIAEVFAAAAMLVRLGWGRALGLAIGVVGLAFTGLSLASALGSGEPLASMGVTLVLVAGYGLTVLALVTGGAHFRGDDRSTPGS